MPVSLVQLLKEMGKHEASDLHIKEGSRPYYRVHGVLTPIKREPVKREEILELLSAQMPARLQEAFERDGACDFGFSVDPITRFRTNAYKQRGLISIAFRRLQYQELAFDRLGLPEVIVDLAEKRRGLILITGPTGTGKSTTMAAMIDYINATRREHIVTIEDPIEFIFQDKKSIIEQREIGKDAFSFEVALRHALRQDPDVILVGEMRDAETVTIAIRSALTGHLVISTLHTISTIMTVNRVIDYFPPDRQDSVREDLAMSLQGVVAQRLIITGDRKARLPIVEVLVCNPMVAKLIRENRIDDVKQIIQNRLEGMQTFDQSLVDLVRRELIEAEEAEKYCEDVQGFRRNLRGEFAGGDGAAILGGG